jgi:aryl-alcohol dehydrogenase-like predicted oxidoreductase
MPFDTRILGRTGLRVGPIGISASYGVPAAAIERAFDRGVNYLYWGSRRTRAFAEALRHLRPHRDRVIFVLQTYSRVPAHLCWSAERAIRSVGYDRADVLLLGWWNHPVSPRILDAARALRDRGLVRFIALSGHDRPYLGRLADAGDVDVIHVRYNAAHPGAERDVFPHVPGDGRPGLVAFTSTSWGQLLRPRAVPPGERTPTATDCYRFVLSNPNIDACATGPASAAHVEDALLAVERGPMSDDELSWMRRVGAAVRQTAILGR